MLGRQKWRRVVGALAVVWLSAALGGQHALAEVPLPDDPLIGRLHFQSKGCVQCHGFAGRGPRIGPDLGEGHFSGSFFDLGASLWNHVPGMSVTFEVAGLAWPELSTEQTTELLSFLFFIDYLGRPGRADRGERVFEAQGCSSCHDVGGGATAVGPDLGDMEQFASPLFVAQQIWNHGPGMLESMRERGMKAPTFKEGDLADLSAFLRQKATAGPQERLFLSPGNPNTGRALFASKGCKECHGEGGRGGVRGPDLAESELHRSAEGVAATMWTHALGMQEAMRRIGVGWPTFVGSELADLAAFLYFLPFSDSPGDAVRGAALFDERSCSTCHRESDGESGSAESAPRLGLESVSSPAVFVASLWTHAALMKEAILSEGLPWPELSGDDLRDLQAYLEIRLESQ